MINLKFKQIILETKYGDDKIGKEIKKAVDEIPSITYFWKYYKVTYSPVPLHLGLSLSMQNVALMELMMSGRKLLYYSLSKQDLQYRVPETI